MTHDANTASLRKRLGETSSALGQIKAQGDAITSAAEERFEQVVKRLEELRTKAVVNHDAANEYLALTKEKGVLLRTLARG